MINRIIRWVPLAFLLAACATLGWPLDAMRSSTVLVEDGNGHGTGVVVGARYILTAGHNADGIPEPMVRTSDGRSSKAKVAWRDKVQDVAIYETADPLGILPARIDCRPLRWGEPVATVGHQAKSRWLLAQGHVSIASPYDTEDAERQYGVQMPVNFGMSGGGVFDEQGAIVGVITAFSVLRLNVPGLQPMLSNNGTALIAAAQEWCPALRLVFPALVGEG